MRETVRAKTAWMDYLALGAGRSLERLLSQYREGSEGKARRPTLRMATLAAWSSAFGWQQRLADEADRQAREIAEAQAAYRRAIMEEGLALDHERVRSLKELAAKLYEELTEGGRLWVTDKKGIGSGNSFEAVDIERFNAAEVEQLRGLLDDIAREKSERAAVQKLQHSGKVEGGSVVILMPDNGRGDREPD